MKIVSVVGARPQFVKAAVLRKYFSDNGIEEILVHTGQHYDENMSKVFFDELKIKPAEYSLSLKNRSHGGMTAEILTEIEKILLKENPDACLVYGDTNSTLAAALAASKLHIPVCHVEAGLRSFNKKMPEEINRILTDHVSSVLFCSTSESIKNLELEGVTDGVHHVGDIMYDAVRLFAGEDGNTWNSEDNIEIDTTRELACLTLHRQENLASTDRAKAVVDYVKSYVNCYQFIFPIHPNTKNKLLLHGIDLEGIDVIDPLSYTKMQNLLASCDLLFTDSGGMQKEAYFHGKRCITLRDETEWVETISHGWNRLWISEEYVCEPMKIVEYGDGFSAEKMAKLLSLISPI